MNKIISLSIFSFLLTYSSLFAQIESGKVGKDAKKVEKVKKKTASPQADSMTTSLPESSLFLGVGAGQSYRLLAENTGIYGEPLGYRSDETPVLGFQFQAGLRSKLSNNFYAVFGIGVTQNGEQYAYSASDSSFSYTTRYRNIALPLGLQFNTGNKLRFVATVGVQPQLFLAYQQEVKSKTTAGEESSTKVKQLANLSPFTFASFAQAGLEWRLSSEVSMYLTPELRYQLSNTFGKQAPYKHNAFVYGLQVGIHVGL